MDKKTLSIIIIILLVIGVVVGIVGYTFSMNNLPETGDTNVDSTIVDFDTCAAAGFPIMESYPPQCRTADGRTFVQDVNQIANPASEFCIENGGRLEYRQDLQGEAGYCIFDNDKECEEWAYFNGECSKD